MAEAAYRDAMARLASGVCVVTTRDLVGRDCGITVTAFSAVSLRPPLVLVCVRQHSFVADALSVADGWAVNLLAEDQLGLARYASRHHRPGDTDDFGPWPTRRGAVSDALVFTDAVAAVECLPNDLVEAGDHTIAIGHVVTASSRSTEARPLLYVDRGYAAVAALGRPG